MIPKFRAWYKENKEMKLVNEIIGLYAFDNDYPIVRCLGDVELLNNEYELMQSTGLHDKYGVEIFEGDIVHWFSTVLEKSEWTGTVIRDGAEMCIQTSKRSRTSGGLLNVLARDEAIKVIGNVYENIELLEDVE